MPVIIEHDGAVFNWFHDSWNAYPTYVLLDHTMTVRAKPWTYNSNSNTSSCDGSNSSVSGWSGGNTNNFLQQLVDECGSLCEASSDNDSDGVINEEDNCPDDANTDQADGDGDGIGDVCDDCHNSPGDVNSDFNIDILDIVSVVNIVLSGGINSPDFNDCEKANADLNNDELINILDIISVINIILGNARTADLNSSANIDFLPSGDDMIVQVESSVNIAGVELVFQSDYPMDVTLKDNSHIEQKFNYGDGINHFLAYSLFNQPFDSHTAEFIISSGSDLNYEEVHLIIGDSNGEAMEISKSLSGELMQNGLFTFALTDVYPNPFNPSTEIHFTLPQDEFVKLSAYDVKGREVDVIFQGYQSSGAHEYTWNAADYPSGLYLIRLQSGNKFDYKRALLIK